MDIKVTTLYVRGADNNVKRNCIYSWIRQESYDIYFLQVSYCTYEIVIGLKDNREVKCCTTTLNLHKT